LAFTVFLLWEKYELLVGKYPKMGDIHRFIDNVDNNSGGNPEAGWRWIE
jgi:hypothetical protein